MANWIKIKNCRACSGTKLVPFFNLGRHPLANSLLETVQQKEEKFPLSLSWCCDCNLVQLNHTVSPKKLFSKYIWVTGTSEGAGAFAEKFCDKLLARHISTGNPFVIELASNDGTFLRPFKARGFNVLGIDPAKNIVKIANASGIPSKAVFFGEKAAKKIIAEYGQADVVFARNVLPHVADTRGFVGGLSAMLKNKGTLAVEVHYAKVILEKLHYDSIYHEHLCYFTLKNIERLLNSQGLHVFDIDQSPISGGSIIVYADKTKKAASRALISQRKIEEKSGCNELASWKKFGKFAENHRTKLNCLIAAELAEGRKICGYGASARSSTMLNFCGIDSKMITAVYDKNTLKQGKYTAGMRIPITSPKNIANDAPDTILLLAWNFAEEIVKFLNKEQDYKGRYILPLPNDPRIISNRINS